MNRNVLSIAVLSLLAALSCRETITVIGTDSGGLRGKVALAFDSTPPEIISIVARLRREGMTEKKLVLSISDSNRAYAEGTFVDVEAGRWHLIVEALDEGGVARFRGEADVVIVGGETTTLDLYMHPTTGNLEIRVHWGIPMPPHDSTLTAGLMLYMPFDGDMIDYSGRGNDGSSTNESYTSDPWGNPGHAYLFNGHDNFVTVPNSPSLNPVNQLTIACWLRVDSVQSDYSPILGKIGPYEPGWPNRTYYLVLKSNYDYPYVLFCSAGDNSFQHELDSHGSLVRHWWYFTGVIDRINHSMKIYINGNLDTTIADSYSSFNYNNEAFLIGHSFEIDRVPMLPFKGAMDNLRLYNRALSPREIRYLFDTRR